MQWSGLLGALARPPKEPDPAGAEKDGVIVSGGLQGTKARTQHVNESTSCTAIQCAKRVVGRSAAGASPNARGAGLLLRKHAVDFDVANGSCLEDIVSQGSIVIKGSDKSADVEEEGLFGALPSRKKWHRKTRGLQHALRLKQDAACQQVRVRRLFAYVKAMQVLKLLLMRVTAPPAPTHSIDGDFSKSGCGGECSEFAFV